MIQSCQPGATRFVRHGVCALAVVFGALGAAGCYAAAGGVVYGYPVAEVEVVPVEIATYPRYYYRGSYAYLVDGRWYYRSGARWVVFESEPPELRSYRYHVEPHLVARGGVIAEVDVMPVEVVPVNIDSYPRAYYRGSLVFLVDGHWYTRVKGRWGVLRTEPRELTEHRVIHERRRMDRRPARPEHAAPPSHPSHRRHDHHPRD
jgi:hypothetical protein